MENHEVKFIGYYSPAAARDWGTAVYLNAAGEEVEVTAVYKPGNEVAYGWKDTICLGEVEKWVRSGRPGKNKWMMNRF